MILTSLQNPRVKQILGLRERRQRKREGLMVVDGRDEIGLALDSGIRPAAVYYCPALFGQGGTALLERVRRLGCDLQEVDQRVFEKLAYRENPDGWLASMPAPAAGLDDLRLGPAPLLMVVEAVEKPGNLGAILRSADAAGADGLVLCDPAVDLGNPNVIRSSRGTIFSLKVAEADGPATLAWLKSKGIRPVAATPEANRSYTDIDWRGPSAIVVGAEGPGLGPLWREGGVETASIPMRGRINSLNVAQAATLFLFEAVRQRRGG